MRYSSTLLAVIGSLLATAASAQAPQCTVPNTLVNGQVADATDVMENFNAVADCVESARGDTVTHDGTPATGQVAVFASPTGITGGNLTGDVTTSGATATQLAPSGVTPGTYNNPTVTVDAKGRVTSAFSGPIGGGSGILAFTTLFYQSAYTLPAGTSTILNVTNANEVMVIGHNITKSVTGAINVQFSVDGGATYVSTNVYLLDISTAGAVGTNPTSIGLTDVTTSARSFYLHVPNLRSSTPKFFLGSRAGIFPVPSPITHIRVYSTAGNVTGGSLTVLAR
jgi:hypothetical protein